MNFVCDHCAGGNHGKCSGETRCDCQHKPTRCLMTYWFTSDWHFGHRNILTLGEGRPFDTLEEHDKTLIERHNAAVKPDDHVWVLGDVAMGKIEESLARCARMNGRKFLVCGNHDRPAMTIDGNKRDRWIRRYIEEGGFDHVIVPVEATDWTVDFELPSGDVGMSHYPYSGDSQETERYADPRPVDHGRWLLHGHVHHSWRANERMINVGVDVWDYAPVSAATVVEIIQQSDESAS